jgi:nucleotidyltransferase/DNA polymerase involved in DNA repair
METLTKIKDLVESLSVDLTKFYEKTNKSAGVRARKSAQEIKSLCQDIRKEILEETKNQ